MLDDEPNDPTTPAPTPDPTAPPVKAVRRRRATQATAAPDAVAAEGGVSAGGEAPGRTDPSASTDTASYGTASDGVRTDGTTPAVAVTDGTAPAATPAGTGLDAEGATGDGSAGTVDAAAETAPPAKRVRKAPAKRAAPRKRTAKTGQTDAESPDAESPDAESPVGVVSAIDEVALAAAADPLIRAVAEVLGTPGEPVVEAVEDDPRIAEAADDGVGTRAFEASSTAEPAPAEEASVPRTRRRRASAVVTFQAPADDAVDAPTSSGGADPLDEPSLDEAPAPRRRRRAGTAGALPASALAPTLQAPEPVPVPFDEDAPAEDEAAGPAEDEDEDEDRPRRRRRGRRGRGPRREDGETAEGEDSADDDAPAVEEPAAAADDEDVELNADGTRRRRRRRRRSGAAGAEDGADEGVPTVVHVREPRAPRERKEKGVTAADEDGVRGITGSTRMAAKRVRRQEGRDSGRRRPPILSEAEFLARREAVDRTMVVRQQGERTQIAVLEDGVLVEHYVTTASAQAFAGNVYLGKVQNVLPSMEAAFIDVGKGKNGVLYAGEVNYDAQLAGNGPRKIESVLKSGQDVLVQVTKDPMGHKGARLTSQVSLPGRYLVYVPQGSMTGISRKLPELERTRLKAILKQVVPDDAGVIIRTAAEGASEEELAADVRRLQAQWDVIRGRADDLKGSGGAPALLHAEPDLVVRVVRDVFNEDFARLVVQGDSEWDTIREYVEFVAPDLAPRLARHESDVDVFAQHRVDEQLAKALDRKVWLPSGGSLVIDRTEAMVVIDVNTGKYVGKGGNLEETVTRNNLEAAEEIARQLRLRDIGGIIVVDFIDMVLESNRDLVVRRLVECLGRDRTKHQVAEVTSLGLVQMTRKRVGQGLLESFSHTCEHCEGRGVLVSEVPVEAKADRDDRDDRADRDRPTRARKAPAPGQGPALVAAALAKREMPAVVVAPNEEGEPFGAQTPDGAAPEREPGTGRGRRRRGGRGAGSPALEPATPMAEGDDPADDLADAPEHDPAGAPTAGPVDDAEADDAVAGTAVEVAPAGPFGDDDAPDLLPELSEQPTIDQENVAVLADDPAPTGPEVQQAEADLHAAVAAAGPVSASGDEPAADEATADRAAAQPAGPTPVPAVDDAAPAPRRRRRATSRPAGPPA